MLQTQKWRKKMRTQNAPPTEVSECENESRNQKTFAGTYSKRPQRRMRHSERLS